MKPSRKSRKRPTALEDGIAAIILLSYVSGGQRGQAPMAMAIAMAMVPPPPISRSCQGP
jgi:hypothetical protein